MSDSVRPYRWQLTRLPCPWDSPGKSTGVGCHCLLQMVDYYGIKQENVQNTYHELLKIFKHIAATEITFYTPSPQFLSFEPWKWLCVAKVRIKMTPLFHFISTFTLAVVSKSDVFAQAPDVIVLMKNFLF